MRQKYLEFYERHCKRCFFIFRKLTFFNLVWELKKTLIDKNMSAHMVTTTKEKLKLPNSSILKDLLQSGSNLDKMRLN